MYLLAVFCHKIIIISVNLFWVTSKMLKIQTKHSPVTGFVSRYLLSITAIALFFLLCFSKGTLFLKLILFFCFRVQSFPTNFFSINHPIHPFLTRLTTASACHSLQMIDRVFDKPRRSFLGYLSPSSKEYLFLAS